MTIEQLNYVIVLSEELSFTNACQRLHLTQPALSQSIKTLENQLGVILFKRTTSEFEITYAGEQFVKAARQIMETKRNLLAIIDDINNLERGRLTIGVPNFRGQVVLSRTLPIFKERYPNIELSVIEENTRRLSEITEKGLVDISIMNLPDAYENLSFIHLLEERILLAAPPLHPICKEYRNMEQNFRNLPSISLADLKDEPFIILKHGHKLRQTTEELFRQNNMGKNIVLEVNNLPTAQQLVANGLGFTFEGEMAARYAVQNPRPVFFTIEGNVPTYSIVAAYRTGNYLSHTTKAYLQIVKESFSNLV